MNRILLAALFAAGLLSCERSFDRDFASMRGSIFKIRAVHQEPSFLAPWRFKSPTSSSGTGFYIGEGRILTNAHVVAQAKYVSVQRDRSGHQQAAYVSYIGHDADLAIVRVEDGAYLDDVEPLVIGGLPALRSPVAAIGYPTGGEQLSITEGVVSRIDFLRYTHSGFNSHLLVQVDSAINPGNSGGPVVQNNRVVGVAFQGHTGAENTGYIIPPEVVNRFLEDISDGTYDGHPEDGVYAAPRTLSNPAMRAYYGLESSRGILVARVANYSPMSGKIKRGDILLEIDGNEIGVDGGVLYRGERVEYTALYDLHQIGDTVRFKIWRDMKEIDIEAVLTRAKPHPLFANVYSERPRFFVFAGLIFSAVTRNYLQTWGARWYSESPFLARYAQYFWPYVDALKDREEIVALIGRLPHPVNSGAEGLNHSIVDKVNGMQVRSLTALKEVIGSAKSEFLVFDLFEKSQKIILDLKKSENSNEEISESYGVSPVEWLESYERDGAISKITEDSL